MREIEIKRGRATKIFSRVCSSIPELIEFEAEPMRPGEEIHGMIEIRGSSWIIAKKPIPQPLEKSNRIKKGYMDSNFAIYVIPDVDVRITMAGSRNWRLFWLIIALSMVAVLASGLVIIFSQ